MKTKRSGRGAGEDEVVIAVPVSCKGLAQSIRELITTVRSRIESLRQGGEAVDYSAVEREIGELTAAIECAAHGCTLSSLEVDARRVEIAGKIYTRVGDGIGMYYTLAGPIQVSRSLYRELGSGNTPVVDAISLRAGVIGDGWLPRTARAMAHELQKGTSREAMQTSKETGRLPYSRASFERVPHLVGTLYLEHRADIEDEVMREMRIPDQARSVTVSLDRACVPMEEPIPRGPGRPRKNAPKIRRVFHQAYCGTVTLHDPQGEALYTIRFGQMPDGDAGSLSSAMANAVYRLREKQPELMLELLADGAHEMWKLLESSLPVETFGKAHRLIDFWHLIEKLSAAATAMYKTSEARPVVERWKKSLKRRKNAAQEILAELENSGCEEERGDPDSERPVHDAITYLRNHAERMNYAGARSKGLPIGSGNVEATCKTLVGVRMKRAGSRWKEETGEHVIKLRALALSDLWDSAMTKLMAAQPTAVKLAA